MCCPSAEPGTQVELAEVLLLTGHTGQTSYNGHDLSIRLGVDRVLQRRQHPKMSATSVFGTQHVLASGHFPGPGRLADRVGQCLKIITGRP